MITRHATPTLLRLSKQYPVVTVTGPRQSGKTTLVREAFPKLPYVSLEDTDVRTFASRDPRAFLAQYPKGAIIDEAQRVPDLFSYIQTLVDERSSKHRFILTGSQNFLLHHHISQSLAGRVAILKLLPFSVEELENTPYAYSQYETYCIKGMYPRMYDKKLQAYEWYTNYIETYVQRDIRQLKNIGDLNTFTRFIKMCAGRSGQILNLSTLAADCGITHNTAKAWLAVLEASYIVFLMSSYHRSFNKRLVKAPKLYFYDTGLVCALLGIRTEHDLMTYYLKGSIFETFVISEIVKHYFNRGILVSLYYWRDKRGNEIDCIIDRGKNVQYIEIKSGKTRVDDYFNGLAYLQKLGDVTADHSFVVYGGDDAYKTRKGWLLNWKEMTQMMK